MERFELFCICILIAIIWPFAALADYSLFMQICYAAGTVFAIIGFAADISLTPNHYPNNMNQYWKTKSVCWGGGVIAIILYYIFMPIIHPAVQVFMWIPTFYAGIGILGIPCLIVVAIDEICFKRQLKKQKLQRQEAG